MQNDKRNIQTPETINMVEKTCKLVIACMMAILIAFCVMSCKENDPEDIGSSRSYVSQTPRTTEVTLIADGLEGEYPAFLSNSTKSAIESLEVVPNTPCNLGELAPGRYKLAMRELPVSDDGFWMVRNPSFSVREGEGIEEEEVYAEFVSLREASMDDMKRMLSWTYISKEARALLRQKTGVSYMEEATKGEEGIPDGLDDSRGCWYIDGYTDAENARTAPNDGTLGKWHENYYIAHDWSEPGKKILTLGDGDEVCIDGSYYEYDGEIECTYDTFYSEIEQFATEDDAMVFQTCLPYSYVVKRMIPIQKKSEQ